MGTLIGVLLILALVVTGGFSFRFFIGVVVLSVAAGLDNSSKTTREFLWVLLGFVGTLILIGAEIWGLVKTFH